MAKTQKCVANYHTVGRKGRVGKEVEWVSTVISLEKFAKFLCAFCPTTEANVFVVFFTLCLFFRIFVMAIGTTKL